MTERGDRTWEELLELADRTRERANQARRFAADVRMQLMDAPAPAAACLFLETLLGFLDNQGDFLARSADCLFRVLDRD